MKSYQSSLSPFVISNLNGVNFDMWRSARLSARLKSWSFQTTLMLHSGYLPKGSVHYPITAIQQIRSQKYTNVGKVFPIDACFSNLVLRHFELVALTQSARYS